MTDLEIIKHIGSLVDAELKVSTDRELYGTLYRLNDKGIEALSLRECGIKDLTNIVPHLEKLQFLRELNLGKNQFTTIDPLSTLTKLTVLNLRDNKKLKDISAIATLKNLEILKITDSPLENIEPLKNLSKLKVLWVEVCKIKDISSLQFLKRLEEVILYDNQISDISPLKNLTNLKSLDLTRNEIRDISALRELKNLGRVTLKNNFIEELPSWIIDFRMEVCSEQYGADGYINFFENPLRNPPINIVAQGKAAIQDYFSQIRKDKGKIEYLFEAKLLVLGEGGTGKTSFSRKIRNIHAELPQDKDTTLGIDVNKWSYTIDFPTNTDSGKVNFHVNLWDFGGQKIYQGTHQIFFTDKSFYVLIADTREQKTDFSYWLNTIEQLGGDDSSLIIVLNKKYGHEQKFDESGYRNHFGKLIKDVIELDLKNDLPEIRILQDKVKMYLKQLPGIGDALPPSWINIREALLKESNNFISFDRFREICKGNGILDGSAIHTLSGYFNRIGAFTHYINDSILQERIYLNSNWLVKTVYEVLDNNIAKSKKGRLSETDIKEIWGNNELHYEVSKLAQLMHKFGLMYHISNTNDFVVPAHLPTVTPYEQWEHSNNDNILHFIYEFDKYMPQGIMSRLIVALNHHIKNHDLVWYRGVNIETNGASAEIVESYGGSNRFEIRIAGKNKVELLSIIRERFADVLKPFNKLNYKQLVPCICAECQRTEEPGFHEYSLLLKFKEKGRGSQCPKTGEIIRADELLKITEPVPNAVLAEISEKKDVPKSTKAKKPHLKTVKIFLASSAELKNERNEFEIFINRENKTLNKQGVFIELNLWEDFIDGMSKTRLQDEYNKTIQGCDIFLSLFFTKVGKYTNEEFETAFGSFKQTGKPIVYTYFKKLVGDLDNLEVSDLKSRRDLEKRLKKLGHFKSVYEDVNDLKYQFKKQLEKVLPEL